MDSGEQGRLLNRVKVAWRQSSEFLAKGFIGVGIRGEREAALLIAILSA